MVSMRPAIVKGTLLAALALAALGALVLASHYSWRYRHARRLPDLVELQVFVLYDCPKYGVTKGDQRYVSATGALEACGVPAVSLKFFDGRGTLLHRASTDRRGEYRLFHNATVDDPLADLRRLDIETPRCQPASFPLRLDKQHSFFGESTSGRRYSYRGKFRFFCKPVEPAQSR